MNKILLCIILCTMLFSCNQQNPKEVIIVGKIEGLADSTIIHLFEKDAETPFMTDTAFNEKFKFVFQDTVVNKLRTMEVTVEHGRPVQTGAQIWIQPGAKIKISGNERFPSIWNIESNVAEQQEANKYIEKNKRHLIRMDKYAQTLDSVLPLKIEAKDDTERVHYEELMDSLRKTTYPTRDSIFKNELELLEKGPTYSDFWFSKLLKNATTLFYEQEENIYTDFNSLKSIYNNLSEEQKNNKKAKEATQYLFSSTIEKVKEGDQMADADLHNMDGKVVHIADYTGKYRLLDFWATWCGPCLAAIPEMNEIAEKYKDKLIVFAINSEKKDTWTEFSKIYETAGVNLHDPKGEFGLTLNYGVKGIPHYVLIDPNDKIVAIWAGYRKGSLHTKMDELLK